MINSDRGSVTIEAAFGIATLVIFTGMIIGAVVTLAAYLAAVNTAGAAARAHAIGIDYAPSRGTVEVEQNHDLITITAHIPAVFGDVSAKAIFPNEKQ